MIFISPAPDSEDPDTLVEKNTPKLMDQAQGLFKGFGATHGSKKTFLDPRNGCRFFPKTVILEPRNHFLEPRETRKLGPP